MIFVLLLLLSTIKAEYLVEKNTQIRPKDGRERGGATHVEEKERSREHIQV